MTPSSLVENFRNFIHQTDFPCVGAKSALAKGTLNVLTARDIRSNWDDRRIYDGITRIVQNYRKDRALFQSFAVIFEGPVNLDEKTFEKFLWARAESLTNKDTWLGTSHDARVSDDPDDPHFSLSFGEEAFFIVGLHPNASRPARRFERPVLVFNLHDQFEQLREQGRYERMRAKSGTSPWQDLLIRCWRDTAQSPRRVSTAAAMSRNPNGSAHSIRWNGREATNDHCPSFRNRLPAGQG